MKRIFQRWFPGALFLVMALWFWSQMFPPKQEGFNFRKFGSLPITANGRIQPLDSLARNSLLQLREKQTLNEEPWKEWYQSPNIIPANEWLANVMLNPAVADDWPTFRIDNQDVITLLKLPERDTESHIDGKHYSWNQIVPAISTLEQEFDRISTNTRSQDRSAYERGVVKIHDRIELYAQLKNTVQPENAQDWGAELDAFEKFVPNGVAAAKAQEAGQSFDTNDFSQFAGYIQAFQFMVSLEPPLIVPPANDHGWRRMGDALLDVPRGTPASTAMHDYAKMASALVANKPDDFNGALRDYYSSLVTIKPPILPKAQAEVFFNQIEPFYNAMVIYVLAGLLAIFSWFNLSETLRRSSVWLIWLAFFIHTSGLIYRMFLEGRPPVTNLYSSAIFIGWGAVLLGIILEHFHRNGIGAVVSSGIGFITLIIAHHLALEGDTMEMMRAVLDTNFWLATHVVAVTTGYASTFVAGFLGLIYIILGIFTPRLSTKLSPDDATGIGIAAGYLAGGPAGAAATGMAMRKSAQLGDDFGKSLNRMIYGIVCFATLFSFVGTVLGGIWADQSWGRFWGWDPKENGALIIVLWNALILHLRWGGMVRERGLAVCVIGGNIVTSWSWFGVNMLGIGLHSYGFTEAAFKWLIAFVFSQVCFIILGLLPLRLWKSFAGRSAGSPNPPALKPKPAV